jgi:hypothetical protein
VCSLSFVALSRSLSLARFLTPADRTTAAAAAAAALAGACALQRTEGLCGLSGFWRREEVAGGGGEVCSLSKIESVVRPRLPSKRGETYRCARLANLAECDMRAIVKGL